MQQASKTTKPRKSQAQNVNPFAKALAETASSSSANAPTKTSLLSEAMAKTGGDFSSDGFSSQEDLKRQQEMMAEMEKKKALRKKLHDRVNPVDQADIFSAREARVKKEIESLRHELKMLEKEVGQFNSEIEKTLMTEIAQPGTSGTYYINFFQRLRAFIMLLRQKVKSARTWAKQTNAKKAKSKRRRGPSMMGGPRNTKEVHDSFHHEKSSSFNTG